MRGTEIAYGGPTCYAMCGSEMAYGDTSITPDVVLRKRMVLRQVYAVEFPEDDGEDGQRGVDNKQ
eukprot:1038365-Rhodomonas_salina.1